MTLAFPRVANEGYFYPRQEFRPEFLTKERNYFDQNTLRMNNRRAINPFANQNYFYPAPYLQLPTRAKVHSFKSNDLTLPIVFYPLFEEPNDYDERENTKKTDGSIKLGTIIVLPKESSLLTEREAKAANPIPKKTIDKKIEKSKEKQNESSLIEDIVDFVPEALGFKDEDEDKVRNKTPSLKITAIKNDKYLNLDIKKHPQENEGENDDSRKLPLIPSAVNIRAFNFSNPLEKLQNITKKFSITQRDETAKETTDAPKISEDDVNDEAEDKLEDNEDEKSPFGQVLSFGPKQQLQTFKEGGLIIQRLRVRAGGIAIGEQMIVKTYLR